MTKSGWFTHAIGDTDIRLGNSTFLNMIYSMMYGLPWITIFWDEWGNSAMIFMSDEVVSENHCQIVSQVTKKIIIDGNPYMILFFTCSLFPWTHKSARKNHLSLISPSTVFWFAIMMSPHLTCDVTWSQGAVIVTSYSLIVLAHTNWRKVDLHK